MFEVGNHPARGVVTRGAGYATTGMGAGTAQIKVLYRGSILCGQGVWAQRKELVQVMASVKDVRFGQSVNCFQIQGAQHLAADDDPGQVGHDPCDIGDDPVSHILFDVVPT